MNKAREFLDKYNQLEALIEQKHGEISENSIIWLSKTRRYRQYAQQLNYAREVRNVLSHNPTVGGEYIVQPSQQMLDILGEVITLLTSSSTAYNVCSKVGTLYTVNINQHVLPVMNAMLDRGYSHVPVLDRGTVIGVFSKSALFSYIAEGGKLNSGTTLEHMSGYLPLETHDGEQYDFVRRNMPIEGVEELFEKAYESNNKLKVLLVTEDGKSDSKLLGIISPLDVIGNK